MHSTHTEIMKPTADVTSPDLKPHAQLEALWVKVHDHLAQDPGRDLLSDQIAIPELEPTRHAWLLKHVLHLPDGGKTLIEIQPHLGDCLELLHDYATRQIALIDAGDSAELAHVLIPQLVTWAHRSEFPGVVRELLCTYGRAGYFDVVASTIEVPRNGRPSLVFCDTLLELAIECSAADAASVLIELGADVAQTPMKPSSGIATELTGTLPTKAGDFFTFLEQSVSLGSATDLAVRAALLHREINASVGTTSSDLDKAPPPSRARRARI